MTAMIPLQAPTIQFLPILALAIAVAALVMAIIFYRNVKRYLTDRRTDCGIDNPNCDIHAEIVEVVNSSTKITRFSQKQAEPKPVVREGLSTEEFNMIIDTLQPQIEKMVNDAIAELKKAVPAEKETPSDVAAEPVSETSVEESKPEPVYTYLYAESYDTDNRTFYGVGKNPNSDTIYEIRIDESVPGRGEFIVFEKSIMKVLGCRDFLEGCCDVSGNGEKINTIEPGKVILEGGTWRIEKSLKIRFEQ